LNDNTTYYRKVAASAGDTLSSESVVRRFHIGTLP
jgi:hypothetical protein